MTKADFIRKHSNKTPAEIQTLAKRAGVKLTMGQIYSQRSADKAKRAKPTKRGTGNLRTRKQHDDAVTAFRRAVARIGTDRAHALLDEIEHGLIGVRS